MLNNPLVWWSFLAICLYISDCIIKYSAPLRKWRASEEGSAPPPWAVTIQGLSFFCPLFFAAPSIFFSVEWFLGGTSILPTIPITKFWEAAIIFAGVISLIKLVNQHTTWQNAKAFGYLDESTQIAIRNLNERERKICRSYYDGSIGELYRRRTRQAEQMSKIVSE